MIEVETAGDVTVWTLAHGKANALDLEFLERLDAELEQLRESATRALLITARGRIFCGGVDLKRLVNGGADYVRRFLPALRRVFLSLASFPKPVVCAANGHAIAGGAVLLFGADERVMVDDGARIAVPELIVGVPFPTIAMELVRSVTPPGKLARVVLEGLAYTSEEALALGWVDELASADTLRERALTRADRLSRMPAETFRLTKEHHRHHLLEFVRGPGVVLDQRVQAAWESAEVLASIRAYVERTLGR